MYFAYDIYKQTIPQQTVIIPGRLDLDNLMYQIFKRDPIPSCRQDSCIQGAKTKETQAEPIIQFIVAIFHFIQWFGAEGKQNSYDLSADLDSD